ncbi:hypothetical protein CP995_25515, partial [Klebsiella pneumoniae]
SGSHMWSQALQTYRYLREKVNRGELQLPERARGTNTFGHLKKQAQQKTPLTTREATMMTSTLKKSR